MVCLRYGSSGTMHIAPGMTISASAPMLYWAIEVCWRLAQETGLRCQPNLFHIGLVITQQIFFIHNAIFPVSNHAHYQLECHTSGRN